jgi:hypothetical protein
MSQAIGHLDFFPNSGKEMPGCQRNILSQIVDIDGIWEGKTIMHVKDSHWGKLVFWVAKLAELYRSHILFNKVLSGQEQ